MATYQLRSSNARLEHMGLGYGIVTNQCATSECATSEELASSSRASANREDEASVGTWLRNFGFSRVKWCLARVGPKTTSPCTLDNSCHANQTHVQLLI